MIYVCDSEETKMTAHKLANGSLHCRVSFCAAAFVALFVLAPMNPLCAQQSGGGAATLPSATAQDAAQTDRQKALDLYTQGRLAEALPLLERLANANPQDAVIHERWGVTMMMVAAAEQDANVRRQMRIRARQILLEAKQLGDNSQLENTLLAEMPADGRDTVYSNIPDAQNAMRMGEAMFATGDYNGAQASYEKALAADPNLYIAAVDIADTYYRRKEYNDAGKWFDRAIQMNPGIEIAYRYWGDALFKDGKPDDARAKYIDAVIAEPYNRTSWNGLVAWAQQEKATLTHPDLRPPNSTTVQNGAATTVIAPSTLNTKDGSMAWLGYDATRVAWHAKKFADTFPNEPQYRHSLAEEVDAYSAVASRASEGLKSGEFTALTPALQNLVKLKEEGLLESYILLARGDAGIAKDYAAYREAHRDQLRQYMNEWVIHLPAKQ
jgi:tetratricopeptide (TPR) repeat protein